MKTLKTKNRRKASGVVFGLNTLNRAVYSPVENEGHIFCAGGSGMGKTTSLLVPTLQRWEHKGTGTFFSVDICGDIHKSVPSNAVVYEVTNESSSPYDVFAPIDKLDSTDDKNEALDQLAHQLMPDNLNMSENSKFFHDEGRKILTAALIAFYHTGRDFIEICETVLSSSWQNLFAMIDQSGNKDAIMRINSFEGSNEKNTAGCKQACDAAITLFATNKRVMKSIHRPFEDEEAYTPAILEEKSVFVIIDDEKLELYAPLLHLITAQTLEYLSSRSNDSKTTILLCLDEFASLGKLDITAALRKLRKKHVRIMVLTQSLADIDLIYGRAERMAMMNNFKFKVILGVDDTDSQRYFSDLIGEVETKRTSYTKSGGIINPQVSQTDSYIKEYAIQPSDLARLGNHLILLYPGGFKRLKKNYYFR